MNYRKGNILIAWLSVFFLFFPFISVALGATVHLATEVLIFSIFAVSYNLLLGYTGSVSFGHAAFFGAGGYVTGIAQNYLSKSEWLSIPLGVVAATIFSCLIGIVIIRKSGIYFALLTMAFGQMLYFLVYRFTSITGGENGLSGIKPPVLEVSWLPTVNFANGLNYYYLVLFFLIATMLIIWRIINSPFGKIIQGIKDNDKRVTFLGYDVQKYRLLSFVLSAVFAGLAGSLYAILLRFAFPQTLRWTLSGDVVMMTLIGGMNNFFGPIVGAGVFLMLRDLVSDFTERWMIIVGSIFIGFVMMSPEGLLGLFKGRFRINFRNIAKLFATRKT